MESEAKRSLLSEVLLINSAPRYRSYLSSLQSSLVVALPMKHTPRHSANILESTCAGSLLSGVQWSGRNVWGQVSEDNKLMRITTLQRDVLGFVLPTC